VTGIEVGVAVIIGVLVGRFLPNRRKAPKAPEPVCGCEHHYSYHAPATGECHGRCYDGSGIYSRCSCRHYSGPQPLPEFYAPEITGGQP
jgi:hypothetical protein